MRFKLLAVFSLLTLLWHCSANSQQSFRDYPSRPIRLIVPLAPGGGMDIMARTLGSRLSSRLGTTIIVDNRPGGRNTIGTEIAAKSSALTYSSAGNGSSVHLAGELFKYMAGVEITHVPYKGMAPALNDVIAGQVAMTFSSILPAMPHVRSGRLRALAVTGATRSRLCRSTHLMVTIPRRLSDLLPRSRQLGERTLRRV